MKSVIRKEYLYLSSFFPAKLEKEINEHSKEYVVVSHYIGEGLHTVIMRLKGDWK